MVEGSAVQTRGFDPDEIDWDGADVQSVGGFDSEVWDEGSVIVGFLDGTRRGVGPHKSTMYELDTADGRFSVWGSTVLDNLMEEVPSGALVRIEPLGTVQGAEYSYKNYGVKFRPVPGAAPAKVLTDAPPF